MLLELLLRKVDDQLTNIFIDQKKQEGAHQAAFGERRRTPGLSLVVAAGGELDGKEGKTSLSKGKTWSSTPPILSPKKRRKGGGKRRGWLNVFVPKPSKGKRATLIQRKRKKKKRDQWCRLKENPLSWPVQKGGKGKDSPSVSFVVKGPHGKA